MAAYNTGYDSSSDLPQANPQMDVHGQTSLYVPPQGLVTMNDPTQGTPPVSNHPQGPGMALFIHQEKMYKKYPHLRNQPAEPWMERPLVIGCPPGLEYLTQMDELLLKQIKLHEVWRGSKTSNRYDVKNVRGQTVYKAKEDSGICCRYCCQSNRPFTIHISDNMNNEVIQIRREYKCHFLGDCCSCSNCCQYEIEVEAPPGVVVGYVKQCDEGCNIRYSIMDDKRNVVLRIHGGDYCSCEGNDYPLSLMSANNETKVGGITKKWKNLYEYVFRNDTDDFGIQFPVDLDVRLKAVVLGAFFLIDFMILDTSLKNKIYY